MRNGVLAALYDLGLEKSAEVLARVRSKSTKGKRYTVRRDDGQYRCTCPDYLYRQAAAGGQCKHITAVIGRQKNTSEK